MKCMLVFTSAMLLFVFSTIGAANAASSPSKASAPKATAPRNAGNQDRLVWEKTWQDTLAAAKKEGEVTIYLNASSDARTALTDAFYKKFGLKVGVTVGSGGQLEAKLISEYNAGINQVDLLIVGAGTTLRAKQAGLLSRIEPMFILPEVKGPEFWRDGVLPFFDRDGMVVEFLSLKNPNIMYNADLVKEGEITSYLDILKPQWKGKTVMYDPTGTGGAQTGAYNLTLEWGTNEKVYEYIVALIKKQNAIVTRDMRQQVDWVARGKYLVALWPQLPAVAQYLKAGVHIVDAELKERGRTTSGNGGLGVPTKTPHPNAAIIFLNWFLSREGQTIAVKTMAAPSCRIDVPADDIAPMFIPKTGEKYFPQNEETTMAKEPFAEGLRKVFAELNK